MIVKYYFMPFAFFCMVFMGGVENIAIIPPQVGDEHHQNAAQKAAGAQQGVRASPKLKAARRLMFTGGRAYVSSGKFFWGVPLFDTPLCRIMPEEREDLERVVRFIIRNPFSTGKMEFKPPNAVNKDGAVNRFTRSMREKRFAIHLFRPLKKVSNWDLFFYTLSISTIMMI